jgi:hypothetical protein
VAALAALAAGQASGLEVKNARLAHGPFGVVRAEKKFLPGDFLFLMFDIDGLATDDKTGKVSFETTLEVFDSKKNSIYSKDKNPLVETLLQLGGNRVPAKLELFTGFELKPGTYSVKFKVTDRVAKTKKTAEFTFPFELLAEDFGVVQLKAPAYGLPDSIYPIRFALVNSPLDKKKMPSMDITMRVFEEGNKTDLSKPISINLPAILPDDFDAKIIPLSFDINLTRPGKFVADFEINEKINSRKLKFQVPFTVLEIK